MAAGFAANHDARPVLQPIDRTADRQRASVHDVGVDHRRAHISMTEQFLHCSDVVPVLEQMRREAMPEGTRTDAFRQTGLSRSLRDGPLHDRLMEMKT